VLDSYGLRVIGLGVRVSVRVWVKGLRVLGS
jgi:hypothetical protein